MGMSDLNASSSDNDMEYEVEHNKSKNDEKNALVNKSNILNCVAKSNAFFKSQQRGEPDLSFNEKYKIAEELLATNVALFLQRYHKFVNVEDLTYFDNFKTDYEVNFYLEEIKVKSNDKKSKAVIKNRRYEALKKLSKEGSYFSDREMRHRSPYLYEELVGKYLTDSERSAMMKNNENPSFSNYLMDQIDRNYDESLLRVQENNEEIGDIELGEIDEDDDKNSNDDESEYDSGAEESGILARRTIQIPSDEKERLRTEFLNLMYENFLSGKDSNFDYSTVDENNEYDSVQQRTIDEEEKYFDEDSNQSIHD